MFTRILFRLRAAPSGVGPPLGPPVPSGGAGSRFLDADAQAGRRSDVGRLSAPPSPSRTVRLGAGLLRAGLSLDIASAFGRKEQRRVDGPAGDGKGFRANISPVAKPRGNYRLSSVGFRGA